MPAGSVLGAGSLGSEVAPTLKGAVPQTLGWLDQLGLWGNLGVSLLGFTGAVFVLQPGGSGTPELSLAAAVVAIVAGTVIGTLAVAASAVPGARTGAPAMVLLRGLFGARLSYLPTALNIVQCLGWGTFELVTIATATRTVLPGVPRWVDVITAGVLTTGLCVRPLGAVRILRRYVTAAVAVILVYLFVEILRHPLPPLGRGSWSGFWPATDTTVAVAVSFVPLASDYTRHARSSRSAFGATLIGYTIGQTACYLLGLLALVTAARNPGDIYGAFIAVPAGTLAFVVLAAREIDQSFANVYSTATSTQNLAPRLDRRLLAIIIGTATTLGALWFNISDYQDFLLLLGSVFVPMFAVLVVDFFVLSAGQWDLSERAPGRPWMLVPWAIGFVTYQLINPGTLPWWVTGWTRVQHQIDFTPASWMSASACSFAVAAALTSVPGVLRYLRHPATFDTAKESIGRGSGEGRQERAHGVHWPLRFGRSGRRTR
jgi:NCS1 family nucleobase:cation symporter-1